mmetsp:Transcript_7647/g.24503  ORF Transcript_7647/g.24503 Transcript_7647/m.24503 type:complete len:229 (-) Transcript_7647:447-1133(-)
MAHSRSAAGPKPAVKMRSCVPIQSMVKPLEPAWAFSTDATSAPFDRASKMRIVRSRHAVANCTPFQSKDADITCMFAGCAVADDHTCEPAATSHRRTLRSIDADRSSPSAVGWWRMRKMRPWWPLSSATDSLSDEVSGAPLPGSEKTRTLPDSRPTASLSWWNGLNSRSHTAAPDSMIGASRSRRWPCADRGTTEMGPPVPCSGSAKYSAFAWMHRCKAAPWSASKPS